MQIHRHIIIIICLIQLEYDMQSYYTIIADIFVLLRLSDHDKQVIGINHLKKKFMFYVIYN